MLVKTDRNTEIELARFDRHLRAEQCRSPRRAAISDVDELEAGHAEMADHAVRVPGRVGTAISELDVFPGNTGIAQRLSDGEDALIQARQPFRPTEAVDTDADDADVAHVTCPLEAKAGMNTGSAACGSSGTGTSRTLMPMRTSSGAKSTSRASTITCPGSST